MKRGRFNVSPYNDPLVVGGQGTCGYEISQQLPDLDAALFACGAGGLLTGSAGWLKSHNPRIQAFGVSPANSPVMHESMRAKKMVEMETLPTLADTCAGRARIWTALPWILCQRYVDDILLLSEKEIEASIRLLFEQHRLVRPKVPARWVLEACSSAKNTSKARKSSQLSAAGILIWMCSRKLLLSPAFLRTNHVDRRIA